MTVALVLCPVPVTSGVPAADGSPPDYFEFSLEALMDVEIVSGASRYVQKASEAPSSVTIIQADEIAQFGYRSLGELLSAVRGFYVTSDRMYEYLGTRGFNRPSDYNTRFLLLVDGHRVNDNVYDQVPGGADSPVDLAAVERIEIVRGPGASLYGTSALFAVINVVTRPITAARVPWARVDGGSFGTAGASAGGGGRIGDGPTVAVEGSWLTSDGQDLYLPEMDDPATNDGWVDRANGLEIRRGLARIEWGRFRFNLIHYSREKELAGAPWDVTFNDPRNRALDAYTLAQLRWEGRPGGKATLTGSLDVNAYKYRGDYYYLDEEEGQLGFYDRAIGRWASADVALVMPPARGHRLLFGAQVRSGFRADQEYWDDHGSVYLDSRESDFNWGLYAQDEFQPFSGVRVNVGLRHDRHDEFGGTTNPRLALILHPEPGASLKLLYARGFRIPNPYELHYVDEFEGMKEAEQLDPERIETFEIVGERPLSDNLLTTLSVFRSDLRDLISLVEDPTDGLTRFANSGSARLKGAEAELRRAWTDGVTGRISYGFQEARDPDSGEALDNSPRHLFKLGVAVPIAGPDFTTAVEARWMSRRLAPNGGDVAPFWVANLTVTRRRLWGRVDVTASVLNLLDEQYADPVSGDFSIQAIEQDGRALRVRMGIGF